MNTLENRFLTSPYSLVRGECLDVLRQIPDESFDALVTDPPYSSGGTTASSRSRPTGLKYVQKGTKLKRPDFAGDQRDQRSWSHWCTLWLSEGLRVCRPEGYCLMFTDWRQLAAATDAIQAAGWIFRGIVPWDKTERSRAPHTGYFRHQAEYVVWGTKGACRPNAPGGPWPGCFRFAVLQSDKHHQTGKPTELMKQLLRCVRPEGRVLDPFCGSGTTLVAAAQLGLAALGIEQSPAYHAIAGDRLKSVVPAEDLALIHSRRRVQAVKQTSR